jgi:MFS family permease
MTEEEIDVDDAELLQSIRRRHFWFCAPLSCDPKHAKWPFRAGILAAGLGLVTGFLVLLQQSMLRCRDVAGLCELPWSQSDDYAGYGSPVWLLFVFFLSGCFCLFMSVGGVSLYFARRRRLPVLGQSAWSLIVAILFSNVLRMCALAIAQSILALKPMYVSSVGLTPFSYGIITMPIIYRFFQTVIRKSNRALSQCRNSIELKAQQLRRGSINRRLGIDETSSQHSDEEVENEIQLVQLRTLRPSDATNDDIEITMDTYGRPVPRLIVDKNVHLNADRASKVTSLSLRWSTWITLILTTLMLSMLVRSIDIYGPVAEPQSTYFIAIGLAMLAGAVWCLGDALLAHMTVATLVQEQDSWQRFGAASVSACFYGLAMLVTSAVVLVVVYLPALQRYGMSSYANVTMGLSAIGGLVLLTQVFTYKFAHGTQWVFVLVFSTLIMILVSKGAPTWFEVTSLVGCVLTALLLNSIKTTATGASFFSQQVRKDEHEEDEKLDPFEAFAPVEEPRDDPLERLRRLPK